MRHFINIINIYGNVNFKLEEFVSIAEIVDVFLFRIVFVIKLSIEFDSMSQ